MKITFTKYQGTGNDFIMIDCTNSPEFQLNNQQIEQLSHRRFGIGADGVILLFRDSKYAFKMQYYNSDGSRSFCGNGSRCALHFAHTLGLYEKKASFIAFDGPHQGELTKGLIALKMSDVNAQLKKDKAAYILDTGSPHYVEFTEDLTAINIYDTGKEIRYSAPYKDKGINVNFVEIEKENHLRMLTYERGVEAETYSCGTGATAVALAYANQTNQINFDVHIKVKGGNLRVSGEKGENNFYESIYLIGPAVPVFNGEIEI